MSNIIKKIIKNDYFIGISLGFLFIIILFIIEMIFFPWVLESELLSLPINIMLGGLFGWILAATGL